MLSQWSLTIVINTAQIDLIVNITKTFNRISFPIAQSTIQNSIYIETSAKHSQPSRMQPQPIVQPLFSSTKHLIHPFAISVKMKGWGVTNVLRSFWTLINICIHKRELGEVVTQLAECREDLATNSAPENNGDKLRRASRL